MSDTDDLTTSPESAPSASANLPRVVSGNPQQGDGQEEQDGRNASDAAPPARHWRPLLTRWLLTLNPGRTQDEYEKAVRYFFETPGAPQDPGALTFDMLLAYRGALTLRADRRRRSVPRRAATNSGRLAARRITPWAGGAIEGAAGAALGSDDASATRPTSASLRSGPLSPATVNIRLTALRQYLLFAIEQRQGPALGAEQIRSALRCMRNERRRPYQTLAEDEWHDFLVAALNPEPPRPPHSPDSDSAASPAPRGPWGMTRAQRERAAEAAQAEPVEPASLTETDDPESQLTHAHDGRTGSRTAQRDHALISLALATGLRAIELSLLDVGDLVSERRRGQMEWWLALPDEKTKGQRGGRSLPLAPELMATLLDYIRSTGRAWERPADRATPLFLALSRGRAPAAESAASRALALGGGAPEPRYRRLRPEQIRGVIHRVEAQWLAQRRAASDDPLQGVETRHISPHTLRHSAAIALLLGDEATERPPASVEHVRGWLGHFDIRTTQRYLAHLESRDQRRRFAIRPATGAPSDAAPGQAIDEAPPN
jgi:integrase